MINMIIADDELIIRQGLMTIPWNNYGIEVVGVASNGEEAYGMSISANPQILLTDIKMPGMDGLRFIENVRKKMPDVKAILLTGYQDFQYAHSAIQLGATGYVLKPSDPDEIVAMVLKAKQQIEDESRDRAEKAQMLQKVSNARSVVLNSYLQDLLFGRVQESETILEECREMGYTPGDCVVMVIELKAEPGDITPELLVKIKGEIASAAFPDYRSIILDIHPSSYCAIHEVAGTEEDAKEKMLVLALAMENILRNKYGMSVAIGISRLCKRITDLHRMFNQAVNCLRMGPACGKGNILHVGDFKEGLQNKKVINDILSYIEKNYTDEISLISVSEHVHMNYIYLSRLIKKETGETFLDILTKTRMKKACELLANQDFKSYEISFRVGIKDPGYFSQVFKKYCGMTPSEYRESLLAKYKAAEEDMP